MSEEIDHRDNCFLAEEEVFMHGDEKLTMGDIIPSSEEQFMHKYSEKQIEDLRKNAKPCVTEYIQYKLDESRVHKGLPTLIESNDEIFTAAMNKMIDFAKDIVKMRKILALATNMTEKMREAKQDQIDYLCKLKRQWEIMVMYQYMIPIPSEAMFSKLQNERTDDLQIFDVLPTIRLSHKSVYASQNAEYFKLHQLKAEEIFNQITFKENSQGYSVELFKEYFGFDLNDFGLTLTQDIFWKQYFTIRNEYPVPSEEELENMKMLPVEERPVVQPCIMFLLIERVLHSNAAEKYNMDLPFWTYRHMMSSKLRDILRLRIKLEEIFAKYDQMSEECELTPDQYEEKQNKTRYIIGLVMISMFRFRTVFSMFISIYKLGQVDSDLWSKHQNESLAPIWHMLNNPSNLATFLKDPTPLTMEGFDELFSSSNDKA